MRSERKIIMMQDTRDSEAGIALITVIIMTAVLMIISAGMYFVASREGIMAQADNVGGQAFYFAEGGVENVLDMLSSSATESQLIDAGIRSQNVRERQDPLT